MHRVSTGRKYRPPQRPAALDDLPSDVLRALRQLANILARVAAREEPKSPEDDRDRTNCNAKGE